MDTNAIRFGVTRIVDRFLDDVDGRSMTGLHHVLPQFLAEYATWWKHRFNGRMDRGKWLGLGFGGCEEIALTPIETSRRIGLELAEYAGRCFTVRVPPLLAMDKPDLEIRVNADATVTDELYLGHAMAEGFSDDRRNRDCYEIVTRKLSPKAAPCLLDPRQGSSGGALQRYFNITDIHGSGEDVVLTFIMTRVPNAIRDAGYDYDVDPVGVTASLDRARLETGDESGTGSDDGNQSDGGAKGSDRGGDADRKKTAVVDYASKSGRARVSPEGEKAPGDAGPRDIFSGNFDTMPIADQGLRRQMMQMRDAAITVRLEPGEGEAGNEMPAVGFRFIDGAPRPGDSGAVDVEAMSSRGERFGVQDPDRPSRLVIEEYSDQTLRFRGVAHVCEGSAAGLARGADRALCELLERRTYRVEGTVSFPTARNSVARLQSSETDAYLAYRDLRLDALLGPGNSGGLLDDAGLSSPDSDGGKGDAGATGRSPVADDGCDCSCAGRDDDPAAQCKLLCGKDWKACE
ncbi:MAG TPA: hypothetical protein VK973_17565 [Arenicellales bacterium]|nr:hypothetical protein [Arenicellales bacterium]